MIENILGHKDTNCSLKVLLLTLFFCYPFVFIGQIDSISKPKEINTLDFIENLNQQVNIKLDVDSDYERFDQKGSNFEYDIRPNIALKSKLSFSYKFISFGITYLPKFIPGNNDDEQKGKTKVFGIGLNLNLKHWIQDLKYSDVKGFYLYNSGDFNLNIDSKYLLLPDFNVKSFQGSTSYKFNPNFSLKAISTQTEIQLKSAGSFIPGIIYSYYSIDNKSDSYEQQSSQKSNSLEVLVTAGYYHNFVLNKNWFFAVGLSPSVGINYTDLLTRFPDENVNTSYSNGVFRVNGKSGLGYNSERFFGGAEISGYKSFRNENNSTVTIATTGVAYQIFIGYRFRAPKFLKNITETVENKIPL